MEKVIIISLLLLSLVNSDEFTEEPKEQVSAVSKVMERFSKLSTIESTPLKENIEDDKIESSSVLDATENDNLEIIDTIKTAKFESKDVPYPEDNIEEEKEEVIEENIKSSSLKEMEELARKVIEEEMQKVEEAKESALKRIDEVMQRVEDAKEKEGNL